MAVNIGDKSPYTGATPPPVSDQDAARFQQMSAAVQQRAAGRQRKIEEQNARADRHKKLSYADYLSVGGNADAYKQLKANRQGLSSMTDDELAYIQKQYQQDTSPAAYTKSATDKYLQSIGLPSVKGWTEYRAKYAKYAAGGGVDQYKLSKDEEDFIKSAWQNDSVVGLNGELRTKDGKELKYTDTLLDDQLKALGLPPSVQMETYHATYLNDQREKKEFADKVDSFYDAVFNAQEKGQDLQTAWYNTLNRPEYSGLTDYIKEPAALPDQNDERYNKKDEMFNPVFDQAKFDSDTLKAIGQNNDFRAAEQRVSQYDYGAYSAKRINQINHEAQAKKRKEIATAAQTAFSTPATTEEERAEQAKAISAYVKVFKPTAADGTRIKASDYDGILSLVNNGVPLDVIQNAQTDGVAALQEWNKTANGKNFEKWADVEMSLEGLSKDLGTSNAAKNALIQTHKATLSDDFATKGAYDPFLYQKQVTTSSPMSTSRNNTAVVSPNGALYAAVNGQAYDTVLPTADTELLRDYTDTDSDGKALVDYMTADERGAFNVLFRQSTDQAVRYLDDLQTVLENRRDGSQRSALNVARSQQDAENIAYDMRLHATEQQLDSIKEGETTYWQKEAWNKYRDYSDEALQRIIDREQAIIANPSGNTEDKLEAQLTMTDAHFVLNAREDARAAAKVTASQYGYTDEAGQAATETVAKNLDRADEFTQWVNGVRTKEELNHNINAGAGMMQMSVDLSGLQNYEEEHYVPLLDEMTDDQKNRYNWLLLKEGEDAAKAYYKSIEQGLDIAASEKASAYIKGDVTNDVLNSIGTVFVNPLYSGMGAVGSALNAAMGLDTTRTEATIWDTVGITREKVSEDIMNSLNDQDIAGALNFLYNTAMSAADSTMAYLMSGGLGGGAALPIGELMLSSSAYSSTLRSALNRGLSSEDAAKTATAAAAIEFITEHMGIDNVTKGLDKAATRAAESGMPYFLSLLAQSGINFIPEALEEGAGGIMETVSDLMINGDKAELIETYNNAVANGMSHDEATKLAARSFAKDVALEMLAGGLAGGGTVMVSGIVQGAPTAVQNATLRGLNRWAQGDDARAIMGHSNIFADGRGIIDRMYGTDVADNIQKILDTSETVGQKKQINAVQAQFANLNPTNELYNVVNNATASEQSALAAMLALDGAKADVNSMEATYITQQASKQSVAQRMSNTNYSWIKTTDELNGVSSQMTATQQAMENAQANYRAKLSEAQAKMNDALARRDAAIRKLASAQGDEKAQTAIFSSLSALNTEIANHQATLDRITGEDARALKAETASRQREVERMQQILDRHYASAASFLSTATSNRSFYELELANTNQRITELGDMIDSMMESDFADANDDAWLETVQQQLADAHEEADVWRRKINKTSPAALGDAITAIHNGSVKDFITQVEQRSAAQAEAAVDTEAPAAESTANAAPAQTATQTSSTQTSETPAPIVATSQNAAESASVPSAVNSSTQTANTAESGVQSVERGVDETVSNSVAEQRKEQQKKKETRTYKISNAAQERFNKIAKKFDCEIVWQTREELGANGKYDARTPNRIYLATDMVADKKLPTDMVVAREFFTHEIVHYVANTKMYQNLSANAMRFYAEVYKDEGGMQYVDRIIESIIDKERKVHNRSFTSAQAREELTAQFAQEVLFSGMSGNTNALNWLANADGGAVHNFLNAVNYLIKRGQVRRMKDGSAIKTLLLDSEYALAKAIGERRYLDRSGRSSAFEAPAAQTQRTEESAANSQQTEEPEEVPDQPQAVEVSPEQEAVESASEEQAHPVPEEVQEEPVEEQPASSADLWSRDYHDWGDNASNSVAAVYEAVKTVNPNLAAEYENENQDVINAVVGISNDVRQGALSPMAAASYLSFVYRANGIGAVNSSFNAAGNLTRDSLEVAQEYDRRNDAINERTSSSGSQASDPYEHVSAYDDSKATSNKESTAKQKAKEADRVMKNAEKNRAFRKGAYRGTDGKQLVTDAFQVYRLNDNVDEIPMLGEEDNAFASRLETLVNQARDKYERGDMLSLEPMPTKETLESAAKKLGYATPLSKADSIPVYFGNGFPVINARYMYEALNMFPDAQFFAERGKQVSPIYVKSKQGDGLIVPIRADFSQSDNAVREELFRTKRNPKMTGSEYSSIRENLDLDNVYYSDGDTVEDLVAYMDPRNRALQSGEMVNSFKNALTPQEWRLYYEAIDNLNQFVPNAFATGEETHLLLGNKLLRLRMLANGEFSVEQVIRALDDEAVRTLYDNYSDFEVDYGRDALERWAEAFEDDVGKTLFEAYDRQRGGYVGLFERSYGGEERAAAVSQRESGRNGQRDISQSSGTESEAQTTRGTTDQSRYSDGDTLADIVSEYAPRESLSDLRRIFADGGSDVSASQTIRYSDGDTIEDLVTKYGSKPQNAYGRENNIVTPKQTSPTNRVSDAVQTLKEVRYVQSGMRDIIDQGVLEQGIGVYNPVTLDNMRQWGADYIAEAGGVTRAMLDLTRDMRSATFNNVSQLISAANQVYAELASTPESFNLDDYAKFLDAYIAMRSQWGRAGKAMQLVNDFPLGRRVYWENTIKRINAKNREAMRKGLNPIFNRNYKDIEVPEALLKEIEQARTYEEVQAAQYAITQYIGEHSPLSVGDALRNWRFFSMLANPVTHARNMLGNLTMLGARSVKDLTAAGIENVAVRLGLMAQEERTHAAALIKPEVKAAAKDLWAEYGDSVQSGGHEGFQQQVDEARKKSPFRIVDTLMRFSGNALESEDRLFLYATFTDAASQFMTARGIDPANMTAAEKAECVQYATQQAQEATYRDASKFADMLNAIAKNGTGYRLAVESIMPFKKTPINIAKRGMNYGLYGIGKGLYQIAQNAVAKSRGEAPRVKASVIVDQLAQGLTGTGVLVLGMLLSRLGILKLSAGSGDKDEAFERDIGHQDYSLEIGDVSIKIESLAPMTFPLFMGASLEQAMFEQGERAEELSVVDAIASIADPLMEMSFMSSVNGVLETYSESKIGGVFENMAQQLLGQYFPTIGAKTNAGGIVTNLIDPYRRTTKAAQSAKDNFGGTRWDYWKRSIINKIPLAKMTLEPYVTLTGEYDVKDSFGDYVLANLNAFAFPTNVQIIDTNPTNQEIARIVSTTGATNFMPRNPTKYFTIGGEQYNLTASEYTQYSKDHNELVYAALTAAIASPAYQTATDDDRVRMLEQAYTKAHDSARDKWKAIFAEKNSK